MDMKDKRWPPPVSRFRLVLPKDSCTLSVGDDQQDKDTWVEHLSRAVVSTQAKKNVEVSCEMFGSLGGDRCLCCGVMQKSHFNTSPLNLGVSPLENHSLEGQIYIHKKNNKLSFSNDWKKR